MPKKKRITRSVSHPEYANTSKRFAMTTHTFNAIRKAAKGKKPKSR